MNCLFATLLFIALSLPAMANFLSPGPLSGPHFKPLKGVSNCVKCHKGDRVKACLNCHKEIWTKIKKKHGYHYRYFDKKCQTCHPEHRGKDYDLRGLERNKFKHSQTGWPLTGKHKEIKCEKCHTQKRRNASTGKKTKTTTFLEAVTRCNSCHKDPHKDKYGQKCQDCHNTTDWNQLWTKKKKTPIAQPKATKKPVKKVKPKPKTTKKLIKKAPVKKKTVKKKTVTRKKPVKKSTVRKKTIKKRAPVKKRTPTKRPHPNPKRRKRKWCAKRKPQRHSHQRKKWMMILMALLNFQTSSSKETNRNRLPF